VGDIQLFGAQHAIRIWLDPFKLNNYKLTASDIRTAVSAQNIQVSAGQIGAAPSVPGQELNATVTVQSRLRTPDQFRDIVLRTESNGGAVRLGDVARVEMGSDSYDVIGRYNGYPGTAMGVKLAPGANALTAVNAVKSRIDQLATNFPAGVKLAYPVDNTTFIKLSIKDVVKTLFEAIALVVIVMFLWFCSVHSAFSRSLATRSTR
jgi:multidrug efflux pump subunit AcrB